MAAGGAGKPEVPRLVLVAHGSGDTGYRPVIEAIGRSVADELRRRGMADGAVAVTYLDHLKPRLSAVARPGDVVVPLLLSTGFHATTDIPAAAPRCAVAEVLGPDRRLALACADRLTEAGWRPDVSAGHVVLAAAGSSDPEAQEQVRRTAQLLAEAVDAPVVAAYLSAASPPVADAVAGAGAVVPYLLAPGRFADVARSSGPRFAADVIGDHPGVAAVAVDRYVAAAGFSAAGPDAGS